MTPLLDVAVIVPCFKLGRNLLETIESVRSQTLPARELVVIDDGSPDLYTRQILLRLRKQVRIVRTANHGPAEARNLGIQLTSSPLIVFLDADDLLEPTYLEKATQRFAARPELGFVSCSLKAFGNAEYQWTPPAFTMVEVLARGGPHISTMLRRELWEAVGGFDPALPAYEDRDFWLTALEKGFIGETLAEPLLRYRVRANSRYASGIDAKTYHLTKRIFLEKHASSVSRFGPNILAELIRFEHDQSVHQSYLRGQKAALESEIVEARAKADQAATDLRARASSPLDFGDFWKPLPAPVENGGETIYQYYGRTFLDEHRPEIRGTIVNLTLAHPETFEPHLFKPESVDCLLLGDCLRQVPDLREFLRQWHTRLKPGGVILATLPSVSALSDNDEQGRRDLWRFTTASGRALFAELFCLETLEIVARGNLLVSSAVLYDRPAHTLSPKELDYSDPFFSTVLCVRAIKAQRAPDTLPSQEDVPIKNTYARRTGGSAAQGLILLYHRIASLSPDPHGLCVSPEAFAYQMEHVARYYFPMPLESLAAAARVGNVPAGAIAITFDDGYLDNFQAASITLSRTGVPATFFVNSERLEQEHETWWDEIEQMLASSTLPNELSINLRGEKVKYPTVTASDRASISRMLHSRLLYLSAADRQEALAQLRSWSKLGELPPRPSHRIMTSDELRQLSLRAGHSIGAHSTHHLLLPAHPVQIQREEISGNKAALEQLIGKEINSFSYPYGEFNAQTEQVVREFGFDYAVTVQPGLVQSSAHPFRLPRIEIKQGGMEPFDWKLRKLLMG